jgi:hypothetical protein
VSASHAIKDYRTEMNHIVRRSAPRTRDYLDGADDVLVATSGHATKAYRRILHADRDCVGLKRRSGS